MTNAEKFKEVFGFEFELAPYEADCWCPFRRTKCRDTEFDCFEDCVKPFWQSEYKGEPTMPLSVIEKIELKLQTEISRMEEIEKTCDYKRPHTLDWVLKLIKDEVKECTHDKG